MQRLLNQLPDEQLLDIFVLIEDKHEQLAIQYLIHHAHFSAHDANLIVHDLIQQRDQALKRYIQEDRTFLQKHLPRENAHIETEDDFPDEFIVNLDFKNSAPTKQQLGFNNLGSQWLSRISPYVLYGMLVLLLLGFSSMLYRS